MGEIQRNTDWCRLGFDINQFYSYSRQHDLGRRVGGGGRGKRGGVGVTHIFFRELLTGGRETPKGDVWA